MAWRLHTFSQRWRENSTAIYRLFLAVGSVNVGTPFAGDHLPLLFADHLQNNFCHSSDHPGGVSLLESVMHRQRQHLSGSPLGNWIAMGIRWIDGEARLLGQGAWIVDS